MKKTTHFLTEQFPVFIEQVQENLQPLWGQMSAQHMIEHLAYIFNISNGKIEMSVMHSPEKIAKSKRHVFIYKNPFPKNLRVSTIPENPEPVKFESLAEAKKQLWITIDNFYTFFKDKPNKTSIHPFLGPLTYEEWVFFHTKHCSHHLTQFGLMDGEVTP